jgi:hypothetical protein
MDRKVYIFTETCPLTHPLILTRETNPPLITGGTHPHSLTVGTQPLTVYSQVVTNIISKK